MNLTIAASYQGLMLKLKDYSTASESPPEVCYMNGTLPEFEVCQAPPSRKACIRDDLFDFDNWGLDVRLEVCC